ncbi:hypothetical protein [Catalinimonas niigatensis]|uniref:hypothetical protein n=1 Tax=Catalinimonas niigatensis TaxID=1397264 RepID=UPI0026655185|nr:hypothetical protein [Catalinimonas niigatensis]WPP49503.1 hypothetical protein PZB72_22795 [Catalinimonas niigatensis]
MNHSNKMITWRVLIACAIVLTVLTFTPLVIPHGVYRPELFGMPYTLWMTILITILYVVLTFIGTKVHPGKDTDK